MLSEDRRQTFPLPSLAAMTEAPRSGEQAPDLAVRSAVAIKGTLGEYGAREVKRIGDALMLSYADAALATGLDLTIGQ
ncbi:MAG: hypothetical protein M3Y09_16725 [Actinomycetota bacterium]|nr:hypothetical protein [Actinomycetota bacterium]